MEPLRNLQRKLFRSRRSRWKPFRIVKRLGAVLIVILAWGAWKWHVGDGSLRIARIRDTERVVFHAVSPNGDRLLVQAVAPSGFSRYFIVRTRNGSMTPFQSKAYPLRWSRDGKALLCISHNEGLVWHDLASGREEMIPFDISKPKNENLTRGAAAAPTSPVTFVSPSYNGERITIVRSVSSNPGVMLWRGIDGSKWEEFPVPYEMMPVSTNSPGWSPDGKRFAIEWFIPLKQGRMRYLTIGAPNGEWETYRMDLESNPMRWLKNDGTFLITFSNKLNVLRLSQRSSRTIFRATDWQILASSVTPSPDGTLIAIPEQPPQRRFTPAGPQKDDNDRSQQRLVVVNEHGQIILTLYGTGCSAQWSPDGKILYYGRGGDMRALRLR